MEIIIIENNLMRAFALIEALSLIRFKTGIKDKKNIVYIFRL